jgi:hypothetical protein
VLNCGAFEPFDVLESPFEFDGDPISVMKLWVVARNLPEQELLVCFKPTSSLSRYDREPALLAGVVAYEAGEASAFSRRTVIEPKPYPISYRHLRACYVRSTLRIVDRLPDDFRLRISTAVKSKPEWRQKERNAFFAWFQ